MKTITIYGPGCARCRLAERLIRLAIDMSGAQVNIVSVSDFAELARLQIISTPAIAVDGVMQMSGRLPTEEEIRRWIAAE